MVELVGMLSVSMVLLSFIPLFAWLGTHYDRMRREALARVPCPHCNAALGTLSEAQFPKPQANMPHTIKCPHCAARITLTQQPDDTWGVTA